MNSKNKNIKKVKSIVNALNPVNWTTSILISIPGILQVSDAWYDNHAAFVDSGDAIKFGLLTFIAYGVGSLLNYTNAKVKEMASFPEINPGPVMKLKNNGLIGIANSAAKELFGRSDLVGEPFCSLHPDFKKAYLEALSKEKDTIAKEYEINGQSFQFIYKKIPNTNEINVFGANISETKELYNIIKEIAILPEGNPGPVITINREGAIQFANEKAKEIFNIKKENYSKISDLNFYNIDKRFNKGDIESVFSNNKVIETELDFVDETFLFHYRHLPNKENIFIYGSDISNLKKDVKEKEFLIKDVHHRAKNNLQIIASLVNLMKANPSDNSLDDIMNAIHSKIQSISKIHQALYEQNDLNDIKVDDYLNNKVNMLIEAYDAKDRNIQVEVNAKDVIVSQKEAVPFGLILNELITNSLKYAYTGNDNNKMAITVTQTRNKNIADIIYEDNGKGIKNFSNSGFGTDILSILTQQMDLNLDIISRENEGTKYIFANKTDDGEATTK